MISSAKASDLIWSGFLKSEGRVTFYPIDRGVIREALLQQVAKPSVEFPDCVIAATMKENNITRIYTTNPSHFLEFPFIEEAADPRQKPHVS